MITARPTRPAAIPPTIGPVEIFDPELREFPLESVEVGLDGGVVTLVRLNAVVGDDGF